MLICQLSNDADSIASFKIRSAKQYFIVDQERSASIMVPFVKTEINT